VKIKNLLLSGLLLSLSLSSVIACAAPLRLVAPQFPPYTSESDGSFSGIGVDLIKQVMQDIDIEYELRSTPNYARALGELKNGHADGFFLASENDQRNEIAQFSEPLLVNRWSWFFRPESSYNTDSFAFKASARIASIHGSNTYKWLVEHDYNVTTKANSTKHFAEMLLEKKRVDAVFLASVVFRKALVENGYANTDYLEVVEKSKPFGIYINKAYLEKHPGFMEKLNASILKIQNLN